MQVCPCVKLGNPRIRQDFPSLNYMQHFEVLDSPTLCKSVLVYLPALTTHDVMNVRLSRRLLFIHGLLHKCMQYTVVYYSKYFKGQSLVWCSSENCMGVSNIHICCAL